MAIFIPEHLGLTGARSLHIKKALNELGDEYIVRSPIIKTVHPADFFIETNGKWVSMIILDADFASIVGQDLFGIDDGSTKNNFEKAITNFHCAESKLSGIGSLGRKLILLWRCSTEEAKQLHKNHHEHDKYLCICSKEQFLRHTKQLLDKITLPLDASKKNDLKLLFFPESEIHAKHTTKRYLHHDTTAKLPTFFLDAQQEWASKLDLALPEEQSDLSSDFSVRLINGVAGSGKTLIAVNRALLLSQLEPTSKILILIHNAPIVADLKYRLSKIHSKLPNAIEIDTFASWMLKQWRKVPRTATTMAWPSEVQGLIRHFRRKYTIPSCSDAELTDELAYINDNLILDEGAYLNSDRTGRGFSLRAEERKLVWQLAGEVNNKLLAMNKRLWSEPPKMICLDSSNHKAIDKYDHILVDEAQFFAPSWFELIKISLKPNAKLFLCADPNQGFMKNKLSWKSIGLEVRGRTKKLHRSYRTTRKILSAANNLLHQLISSDGEDYLEPDYQGMTEGELPFYLQTSSPQDSIDRVINEIKLSTERDLIQLESMLVIYGNNVSKDLLIKKLGENFKDTIWHMNVDRKCPPGNGDQYLRVAHIDTATGLEASFVFLLGVETILSNESINSSPESKHENARRLYMAMTRAGERLAIVSSINCPSRMEQFFCQV